MSRFTKPLRVSPVPPKGDLWCVIEPFGYDLGKEDSGETVEVPRGFVTDFASVPPGGRWLLPKWGPYGNAAVVHDLLYWEQKVLGKEITRKEADDIMFQAMKVLPVRRWKSWLIYRALRLGGWAAWKQNQLNRDSGVRRVIWLDELEPGYEHKRPGLLGEIAAKVKIVNRERAPSSGLARFSRELAGVVAPAVLERALGQRPPYEEDERVGAGERSSGELSSGKPSVARLGAAELGAARLLAGELRAEGLRQALAELEETKRDRRRRITDLEHQKTKLRARIAELEKPPGGPPPRGTDEAEADYGKRVDELEQKRREERKRLPEMKRQLAEKRKSLDKEKADFAAAIESCEWDVETQRQNAITSALTGLAGATQKALQECATEDASREEASEAASVGLTLALATDRVHALLEPMLLAPIPGALELPAAGDAQRGVLDRLFSARMLVDAVGDLVERRLAPRADPEPAASASAPEPAHEATAPRVGGEPVAEEKPDRLAKVASGFLSAADAIRPHYESNLDSLNSMRDRLRELPEREKAATGLERIAKLPETGRLPVGDTWDLLEETRGLAERVEKVRGDLQSAGVGAMERVLENAGLSPVLQALALLTQGEGAAEGATTGRTVLAARTEGLRLGIADRVAERLGLDRETGGGDKAVAREESRKRMALVERIATSRLLVDEAKELLETDEAMRFLDRRRELERRAAIRVRRERRALWWVLLPLAPAIWLLLRGSVGSLREFFGIGPDPEAPRIYQELGALARTVLSWAGYAYGLAALSSVGLLLSNLRLVPAEGTSPWLLGFAGANFLGCSLYLIWQARSIHLPEGKDTRPEVEDGK